MPPLDNPLLSFGPEQIFGEAATVVGLLMASPHELHPDRPRFNGDTYRSLMVRYRTEATGEKVLTRYATDSGLIPQTTRDGKGLGYNSTNITVRIADLKAAGKTFKLEATPAYQRSLEAYNSRLPQYEYEFEDYEY